MSHDHHEHGLDSIITAHVTGLVNKQVNNPEAIAKIKCEIFSELSDSIRALVATHRRVSPDKFLVRPRKLSDGSCLVLLDMDLPNTSNTYKLIINDSLDSTGPYHLTVFQENSNKLGATTFVDLKAQPSKEQFHEIQRQLKLIRTINPEFKTPAIGTLMHVAQNIEGYEYYQEADFMALDDSPELQEAEKSFQVITRRGPTPAVTSGKLNVSQDGQVTTVKCDS
jgi:hypothetical protein